MLHRRPIIAAWVVLTSLVLATAAARNGWAQAGGKGVGRSATALEVRVGWGGAIQAGRWHPVYLTLSHPVPLNITLEFRAPHGSFYGMRSRQLITIGPESQTFVVYMPLRNFMPDDLAFVVRDAATRKQLANYPAGPYVLFAAGDQTPPGYNFLGISGRRATLRPVIDALPGARLAAAHIEEQQLPTSAVGYDCLDVLVLNAPEFTALTVEQQQAIVDWVRAGGNLLLWPGDSPVPESGPLLDILPCRIGTSNVIELSPDELKSAGLTPRFAKLPARVLTPAPGADAVTLFALDRIQGFQNRVGLGRILVCPIDLASLHMTNPQKTWALWRVVLKGMIRRLPDDAVTKPEQTYDASLSATQQRQANALRQLGDLLGSIPGAGQFGFGYVAGVLIAMMVIVGPVDWILLKKLGRQPWTWATTTGWIALVTLSAVYAGHLFKSGELHFRTFQLVDQADGLAVARTDLSALYSPQTTRYELNTPLNEWWQPASPGDEMYGYRRSAQEIVFAQTYRGSTPDPMVVNVWNLRFLEGESTAAAPPLVEAKLKVERRTVEGKPRKFLVGTVTNVGPERLINIAVATQAGWVRLFNSRGDTQPAEPAHIDPGQTLTVDAMIDTTPVVAPSGADLPRAQNPYYQQDVAPLDPTRLWDRGGDLSMRRTDRINQWVSERADLACVYAECHNPAAVLELKDRQPIEAHWKVVRALVTLEK